MSLTVLMIAEKPSICTSIATALCSGKITNLAKSPPVYEFNGIFRGQPALIRVSSVTGHVFSTDFPPAYQNWDSVDPVELFSAPVISSPEGKGGMVKHLERVGRGVDILVLWLDCDREGENICFEVIRCVEKSLNKRNNSQQIFRAKFSAVTAKDIHNALKNLGEPNENESKAVEARQELDLKVGVAFSRFQTRYFQGKYGDLDSAVISYGPCQTPTLGFCVERHDEIQTFQPETFWTIDMTLEIKNKIIPLEWSRGRLFDQEITRIFLTLLQESSEGLVCQSIKQHEGTRPRPTPLNTVELLKLASKNLGIGPQAAMRAAEHLYLSGYISYPRTESTSYPSSYDIRDAIQIQTRHPHWGNYASELLTIGFTSPRQGHDAGDHPPISPVGLPASPLSGEEAEIYELVCRYFLATISPDATYLSTQVIFTSPATQDTFIASGKKELTKGFERIYGNSSSRNEVDLDPLLFQEGQKYNKYNAKLKTGQTSVPSYLTESELISLMEKHGIGTDASIATHINNICVRNYVNLGPGRTLIPTTLGTVLVHGFLKIDASLVLPEVRATIESFCNMIAKGEATKEQVVQHSLLNFERKFRYFCEHIQQMDTLFEASFSPLAATGAFLSKCGKCLRYMRYIPLKPQRLYCQTCEETYSLPQNGTIKLYKELRCPLDSFELVLFSLGNSSTAQGKSYPLCPYCYNHPPQFDMEDFSHEVTSTSTSINSSTPTGVGAGNSKSSESTIDTNQPESAAPIKNHGGSNSSGMGCNSCFHPRCPHSVISNGICACPGSYDNNNNNSNNNSNNSNAAGPCQGKLILDVNSKPNWKLACNICNTLIRFRGDIHEIKPLARQDCDDCGTRLLSFEFNKLKSPLSDGKTSYTGCIVCDVVLSNLTEVVAGRTMHLTVLRQIRHKRGARGGRRGRGRGRGGGSSKDVKMSFSDF